MESIDRIALIGINRPERRNAIDKRTAKLLIELFKDFEKNSTLDVAVLYGKGGNFCSGFDMKELAKSPDEMKTLIEECLRTKTRPLGPTLKQFEKPVIAAVNGYAVAGGLELALMCDLRIVEETAILGMYNRRFDIPMTDGGSVRLPKMIGLSRALDLIITGRQINGKIAFDWGLANRIVDTGTALGQAMNLARIIGTLPKTSLLYDRNSVYYSTFESCNFEDAMQFELRNANNAITSGTWQKDEINCLALFFLKSYWKCWKMNKNDNSFLAFMIIVFLLLIKMMVCIGNTFNNRSSVFVVWIDDEKFHIFPPREEQLVRSTCLTAAALWNKNVETICPN
ncbi:enoyl-CoA hydratase/isomerase family protein [Trichinella nativa]|uniref:Enoyl-CoA hydratase/isomerase family protein n=1 Tax=Trichinella nativa TaxID=6335 RepID=A0A1Y3ECZ9_9BILA|nr:enoyl-CoA hydratase/isomerase family protein [Trichinella nativa]